MKERGGGEKWRKRRGIEREEGEGERGRRDKEMARKESVRKVRRGRKGERIQREERERRGGERRGEKYEPAIWDVCRPSRLLAGNMVTKKAHLYHGAGLTSSEGYTTTLIKKKTKF
jgi:hypothetical protein